MNKNKKQNNYKKMHVEERETIFLNNGSPPGNWPLMIQSDWHSRLLRHLLCTGTNTHTHTQRGTQITSPHNV